MKYCIACSMPLVKKEDFSQGNENSEFCLHCTNENGEVLSCEEIFNGGVKFFLEFLGEDKELAQKVTRKNMSQLSYWQDKNCKELEGEKATDEEFQAVMQKLQA